MVDAATIVRRIRALSGITRKELAELADLSPSTISRIERGTLDPTWGTLSRILEATGYRISGDTTVSAGDPTAIAAARSVLQPVIEPHRTGVAIDSVARTAQRTETAQWLVRWMRAGWRSDTWDADDLVRLAVSAGNAAKIARRTVVRRVVVAKDGWRMLAHQLGEAGVDYAVSGLVAIRGNRSTADTVNPVIYVEDPARVVEELDLTETCPGEGVLLIAPAGGELAYAERDGGIRYVARTQAVLDAFAGPGREPDKAEATLRSLLAVST